jgi:hypothetical protein
MTGPTDGKRAEDLLWEVLGLESYCNSLLDYLIAGYLGRDAFSQQLLESELVGRKPVDWKLKTLRTITEREGFSYQPYDGLSKSLKALSDFRNGIAHSQPDHGNVLRRLRRQRAQNQPVWELTADEITAQWQLGIECQSQLLFLTVEVSRKIEGESGTGWSE